MKTSLTALTFVLGLAGASLAQDISEMPDDQLLGAVVTATETANKDQLMDLMREVRARGLLMFRPDEALCDAIVPKVGLLENMLAYGNARQAYIVAARQAAMERGDCGCPFDALDLGVDKTWGSCGAFSVCDGQPTIENCGPCDGYSVSPFGRPPHPSALSHAGIGNVID